jgi:DNA-binding response OmpR family regulator
MSQILIVEDEERMAQSLEKGLNKMGYDTHVINNGLMARVQDIREYDLVILDWMLPGFSGLDLLRHWRSQKFATPIMMLTAKGQTMDKVAGLDFGADDYMSKFFEWPELLARVNALLRRNKQKEQIGTIILDRENQVFLEDDKQVLLTAKEYLLLKYFFDHPSALITRPSLIRALYEDGEDPFSNVIERHIRGIRQKLNYDPIQTLRGLGYRLRTSDTISAHKIVAN